MIRKLSPVALVAALALAACGTQGAPRIEDPEEILTQSVEAMSDLESVRFLLALDGEVTVAEMGGAMSLDGTELEGALSLDGKAMELTFSVPSFLGLSGEARIVGDEAFFKTSMTGPLWIRQPVETGGEDPFAQAADPQAALAELREFLARDGVELEKLEDVECGDGECYQLRITIAGEVFAEEAGADVEVLGSVLEDGLTFDLQIDVDTLYMTGVSTAFEAPDVGSLELTMTFDGFGDPVEVEAPPADEVTDDPGMLPLP